MTHRTPINNILGKLRRRQKLLNAADAVLRGLFYGSLLALVTGLCYLVADESAELRQQWHFLAVIPATGCLAMLLGLFRRVDPLKLARAIDRAAQSQDRFASAIQLAGHHRRQRVELVMADALSHTNHANVRRALPISLPAEANWLPAVVVVLALLLWLAPGKGLTAAGGTEPEVSEEQWRQVEEQLRRDLQQDFGDPQLEIEKEIHEQLKQLASSLSMQPKKRNVLARIAKMRSQLQQQRSELKTRNLNMQKAAAAVRSSDMLKKLAELLRKGDYGQAARELKALAELLQLSKLNPSAEQLDSVASDLERLSRQLNSHDELHKQCQQCASAAASLNQQELAKALQRLSKLLDKNADDLKKSDALCRACSSLDQLEQMLSRMSNNNQCRVCGGKNSGNCPACSGGKSQFVRQGSSSRKGGLKAGNGNKKGGLKAGSGTADNWMGGALAGRNSQRLPVLASDAERGGPLTTISKTVSADERAESALAYKKKFAEFVQKAEADLALEEIPIAYRDFLHRYFRAIKPKDSGKNGNLDSGP